MRINYTLLTELLVSCFLGILIGVVLTSCVIISAWYKSSAYKHLVAEAQQQLFFTSIQK
jgi:hypothetical protein